MELNITRHVMLLVRLGCNVCPASWPRRSPLQRPLGSIGTSDRRFLHPRRQLARLVPFFRLRDIASAPVIPRCARRCRAWPRSTRPREREAAAEHPQRCGRLVGAQTNDRHAWRRGQSSRPISALRPQHRRAEAGTSPYNLCKDQGATASVIDPHPRQRDHCQRGNARDSSAKRRTPRGAR